WRRHPRSGRRVLLAHVDAAGGPCSPRCHSSSSELAEAAISVRSTTAPGDQSAVTTTSTASDSTVAAVTEIEGGSTARAAAPEGMMNEAMPPPPWVKGPPAFV